MTPPAFPGGTSVSRLSVYRDACGDGLKGGTPHMHTASAEAYVVVGGRGALHTVDMSGFRETELGPGSTVWFKPGTIHRAVNHEELDVVVVMQNAGLPEAGDAVMTFPPEIVADATRYREVATLPADVPDEVIERAAHRRRELAVEGFLSISESLGRGDSRPLETFYRSAVELVRPRVAGWRKTWQNRVVADSQLTGDVLDALERGDGDHLRRSALLESPPSPAAAWGMCGHLHTHDVARPVVHTPTYAGGENSSLPG